jgi:hypothetical protein
LVLPHVELIKGFLPTAGLKIVLILVPIVLRLASNLLTRNYSHALIDFDVGRKYYIFQMFVVFVFVTILGAASSGTDAGEINVNDYAPLYQKDPEAAVRDARAAAVAAQSKGGDSDWEVIKLFKVLLDNPSSIPQFLGKAIPQQV